MSDDPFEPLLNWQLLAGSHDFPGPDGGTCINEAAIVAAGLPYRAITRTEDCPPCFSRPLAAYALGLNDAMPDSERQRLLAFVMRLAGTADTAAIEQERTVFLALESVRRILPALLDTAGLPVLATRCQSVPDREAALAGLRVAESQGFALSHASACRRSWLTGARAAAVARSANAATRAFRDPRCAAEIAEGAAPFAAGIWDIAVGILDDALRIGRKAPAIDLCLVRDRMITAQSTESRSIDFAST